MSVTTTIAPSAASLSAHPRPIPLAAPVTSATLPSTRPTIRPSLYPHSGDGWGSPIPQRQPSPVPKADAKHLGSGAGGETPAPRVSLRHPGRRPIACRDGVDHADRKYDDGHDHQRPKHPLEPLHGGLMFVRPNLRMIGVHKTSFPICWGFYAPARLLQTPRGAVPAVSIWGRRSAPASLQQSGFYVGICASK